MVVVTCARCYALRTSHQNLCCPHPSQALINKIDSMLERVKTVFIHTLIVGRIKEQLKSVIIGKSLKRNEIVTNLQKTFQFIQEKYKVGVSSFGQRPQRTRWSVVPNLINYKISNTFLWFIIRPIPSHYPARQTSSRPSRTPGRPFIPHGWPFRPLGPGQPCRPPCSCTVLPITSNENFQSASETADQIADLIWVTVTHWIKAKPCVMSTHFLEWQPTFNRYY